MLSQKTRQKVLEFLQEIPKGKVSTYKIIGQKFQIHPRVVGMIMRTNKDPIKYPCYKVVSSEGKMNGYTTERGIPEKIERLQKDGIEVIEGKVDQKYFYTG